MSTGAITMTHGMLVTTSWWELYWTMSRTRKFARLPMPIGAWRHQNKNSSGTMEALLVVKTNTSKSSACPERLFRMPEKKAIKELKPSVSISLDPCVVCATMNMTLNKTDIRSVFKSKFQWHCRPSRTFVPFQWWTISFHSIILMGCSDNSNQDFNFNSSLGVFFIISVSAQ